jgi:hypothetical protein
MPDNHKGWAVRNIMAAGLIPRAIPPYFSERAPRRATDGPGRRQRMVVILDAIQGLYQEIMDRAAKIAI